MSVPVCARHLPCALVASALWLLGCASGRDIEGGPSLPNEGPAPSIRPGPSPSRPAADGGSDTHGYERMLTGARATFGLAESRGIDAARMSTVFTGLADSFEACAQAAERDGWLDRGAVRLVVDVDEHGQVRAVDPKLDDPARGGKVVLLCLVAPIRAQNFGDSSTTSRRGFALEVLFGPSGAPR